MGFLIIDNDHREPFVAGGPGRMRRGRRLLAGCVVAIVATLVSSISVTTPAGAQAGPVLAEPGRIVVTVTGGSLGLGGVDLPLPPCDPTGIGCLSFVATIGADGKFSVSDADLQLPSFELPLEQLGLALPIGLRVEAFTSGRTSGLISPAGRLATLNLGIGLRLVPDLATLGIPAFLARSASCGIGPLQLVLTSGGSGSVTGDPYDAATGAASLVDGEYVVPALTCSPVLSTVLSLLGGGTSPVGDLGSLVGTANQTLGLPTPAGTNAVVFDVVVSRVTSDGVLVPLAGGGGVWPASGFRDVPTGAHFDQAVRWLKAHGVTTGLGGSAVTFGSGADVTRGQMAAFLWRMMDRRPASGECGFNDVGAEAFFARAVCWLKVQSITTGVSGDTSAFAPQRPLTRGEMALFLWRMAGSPAGSPTPTFTDLVSGAAYGPAVAWLAANGITTGVNGDPSRFAPGDRVTRAQMASFLYRLASRSSAWDPSGTLPTTMVPPAT